MTIFAIIAPGENPQLRGLIQEHFPKNLEFSPGQFVISVDGMTAQQVSTKIAPTGSIGRFIVISVAAYWGHHDKNLWEWLSVNAG